MTKSVVATLVGSPYATATSTTWTYLSVTCSTSATHPRSTPPGSKFRYDNGAAHLLGAALSAVVGMPLSAFAEQHLFAPLDIRRWHWHRDPDGRDYGFAHLRLSAADLAKPATPWLQLGRWHGEQLVEANYARP